MNMEQEDEREVLMSIYDGDPAFNQLNPTTYQYKYGTDGDPKSFLIELSWGENYPNEPPNINMGTFYNKHLSESVKGKIASYLKKETENLLGFAMTYSVFEGMKERVDEFFVEEETIAATAQNAVEDKGAEVVSSDSDESASPTKKATKKEHLTKAQKRKQWDRLDCRGERPRGWDWIDVIHHLSQTGPKVEASTS